MLGEAIDHQETPVADMNGLVIPGSTLELANSNTLNSPYEGAQSFLLIVLDGVGNRRIQITFSFDTGLWHRRYRKSTKEWTLWEGC